MGTVVLAAADIDLDVVIARNATERVSKAVEHAALYISSTDKALSFSNWLSQGRGRLGDLDINIFSPSELEALRNSRHLQLIDARLHKPGFLGHSYFHTNPSVSSDLALLMRYQLWPGTKYGRPLQTTKQGIWLIEEGYPGSEWTLPEALRNSNND